MRNVRVVKMDVKALVSSSHDKNTHPRLGVNWEQLGRKLRVLAALVASTSMIETVAPIFRNIRTAVRSTTVISVLKNDARQRT